MAQMAHRCFSAEVVRKDDASAPAPDSVPSKESGLEPRVRLTVICDEPLDGDEETPAAEMPVEPTPELLAELSRENSRLESAGPGDVLRWATERFASKLSMATAFGPEGCTIIHMLAEIAPTTHIFNLDTGYQFQQTLELRDRLADRYGIEVELKRPELTVKEYEKLHNGPLYKKNPNQCCHDRKIVVLRDSIQGMQAWITAIRRDQSPDRARAPIVGWDEKFHLVKINPLANCTMSDVWKMITDNDIPYNPMHDEGYTSIGCQPCTRSVLFGEDERAGRWSGTVKVECGLHSLHDDDS